MKIKLLLLSLILLCGSAQATGPYSWYFEVMNASITNIDYKEADVPADGSSALVYYNATTHWPEMIKIGSGLSVSSGVMTATGASPVNADWNAASGLAHILNKPTLFSGAYADLTGKPTLFDGAYSSLTGVPSTFTPAVHNQAFSTITATPTTLSGYGITDAYPLAGNPSGYLTSINSGQVTTALGFTPYNATNPSGFIGASGARTAVSLTTTGTGAATYNSSTGVLNVPTPTLTSGTVTSVGVTSSNLTVSGSPVTTAGNIAVSLPNVGTAGTYSGVTTDAQGRVTSGTTMSINDAPGRSLVTTTASTGFQISATRNARACYEGTFSTTSTIGGPATATVFLETADTNSTTPGDWTTKGKQTYSNTITLAVVLNQVQGNNWSICRDIPAGKYVRIRSGAISGTASAAINAEQQETIY